MVDVITQLEEFAEDNDYHFIFGSDEYQNADRHGYKDGEIVIALDMVDEIETFTNDNVLAPSSTTYNYVINFGRKFEDKDSGTVSSLDENMKQKYDRRLKVLKALAKTKILEFACANNLGIQRIRYGLAINSFDDNIDFVSMDITFAN